jgi:predicted nucleic acid-binding protein
MSVDSDVFIDTNILVYLLSDDSRKADRAEGIIEQGGVINVQVLNEFTHVARRKLSLNWHEIREILNAVRKICKVEPLTPSVFDRGCLLGEKYRFSVYDSMIVAAALEAGCSTLVSEDMQNGLIVDKKLAIVNPF